MRQAATLPLPCPLLLRHARSRAADLQLYSSTGGGARSLGTAPLQYRYSRRGDRSARHDARTAKALLSDSVPPPVILHALRYRRGSYARLSDISLIRTGLRESRVSLVAKIAKMLSLDEIEVSAHKPKSLCTVAVPEIRLPGPARAHIYGHREGKYTQAPTTVELEARQLDPSCTDYSISKSNCTIVSQHSFSPFSAPGSLHPSNGSRAPPEKLADEAERLSSGGRHLVCLAVGHAEDTYGFLQHRLRGREIFLRLL